jgi:hypothetical protein
MKVTVFYGEQTACMPPYGNNLFSLFRVKYCSSLQMEATGYYETLICNI